MAAKPVPEGYHTLTPYLIVRHGTRALDFYKRVLRAEEKTRMHGPDGKVVHAELRTGNSIFMLADEFPDKNFLSPHSLGGSSIHLLVYVEDADAVFRAAVDAGASVKRPMADQFYGDRSGTFEDPFGHLWTIATHIEDVPEDELRRRAEACMGEKMPS